MALVKVNVCLHKNALLISVIFYIIIIWKVVHGYNLSLVICQPQTLFQNLDYRITQKEIKSCILKLKPGKAVGMDRISAEMIKASVDQLLPVYDKLFNSIFRQGFYPTIWKESFIVPIFKSGSHKDPSTYRGIAINSALGKVFSMILSNRLETFAKENKLIDDTDRF